MKSLVFMLILGIVTNFTYAQSVYFEPSVINIITEKPASDGITSKTVVIPLGLTLQGKIVQESINVEVEIQSFNTQTAPKFLTTTTLKNGIIVYQLSSSIKVRLLKKDFDKDGEKVVHSIQQAIIYNVPKNALKEDEFAYINVKGSSQSYTLRFKGPPNAMAIVSPVKTDTTLTIINSTSIIKPDPKDVEDKLYPIKVLFKFNKPINDTTRYKIQLVTLGGSKIQYNVLPLDINVTKDQYAKRKTDTLAQTFYVKIKNLVDLKNDDDFYLSIGNSNILHHIRVIAKVTDVALPKNVKSEIYMVKGDTLIHPMITDSVMQQEHGINIQLRTTNKKLAVKDTAVKCQLIAYKKNSVTIALINKTINIDSLDIQTLNHGKSINKVVYIQTTSIKNFNIDEFVYLTVNDTPSHQIRISSVGMYSANKPFWVEIGANFDLLDGLQANNLYGGVFMYKKDATRLSFRKRPLSKQISADEKKLDDLLHLQLVKKGKEISSIDSLKKTIRLAKIAERRQNQNLGLFGGVYEDKTISSKIVFNSIDQHYYDFNSYRPTKYKGKTGYPIFKDTGAVSATTTVNNLGLFFSPQLRITNSPAESNGIHVFVSLWLEMVWQRIKSNYNYLKSGKIDTMVLGTIDSLKMYSPKIPSEDADYRSHFFGVGLPIYFKEGDYSLFVNTIVGLTTQRFIPLQTSEQQSPPLQQSSDLQSSNYLKTNAVESDNWRKFYLFQFRLNEEKYGISFTGEIRGLFYKNNQPLITLALSKKFDLTKLLEFK